MFLFPLNLTLELSTGDVDVLSSANDPEQRKKLAEICELLLAAGYFRVRIQGLGEFDKGANRYFSLSLMKLFYYK